MHLSRNHILAWRDSKGNTLLHKAVKGGSLDVAKRLVVLGVDVNCVNEKGETALHMAAKLVHASMCSMLLNMGALINKPDYKWRTPLFHVEENERGARATYAILLRRGADVTWRNEDKKTAIWCTSNRNFAWRLIYITLAAYSQILHKQESLARADSLLKLLASDGKVVFVAQQLQDNRRQCLVDPAAPVDAQTRQVIRHFKLYPDDKVDTDKLSECLMELQWETN